MFARLMKLFTNPKDYWNEAIAEPGDIKTLLVPQMLILAAIPAGCSFLGLFLGLVRLGFGRAVIGAIVALILSFVLNVGAWIALVFIIDALATPFNAQRDIGQSMKLATGAISPVFLGGLLNLIPIHALGIVGTLAGLGYGAYALYLGLPIMNGTSQEKSVGYTAAAIGLLFVLSMLIALLVWCPATCIIASGISRFP
jgi:hypothetical protein